MNSHPLFGNTLPQLFISAVCAIRQTHSHPFTVRSSAGALLKRVVERMFHDKVALQKVKSVE